MSGLKEINFAFNSLFVDGFERVKKLMMSYTFRFPELSKLIYSTSLVP